MQGTNIVFTFELYEGKLARLFFINVYSEMSKTELNLTVDHQWIYQE